VDSPKSGQVTIRFAAADDMSGTLEEVASGGYRASADYALSGHVMNLTFRCPPPDGDGTEQQDYTATANEVLVADGEAGSDCGITVTTYTKH